MSTHASTGPYSSKPTIEVPAPIFDALLASAAVDAGHFQLCQPHRIARMAFHPGDPFGALVAWLWVSGRRTAAAILVADYLAQMRVHSPNHPEDGNRLTWAELREGLRFAAPNYLERDQLDAMLDYLDEHVPSCYGGDVKTP